MFIYGRYDGPLQHWTVSALTSRSVWTNVGNFIIAPYVYNITFGSLSNGIPCAAFTFAVYATGSICVVAAHWLNMRQVRIRHDEKQQQQQGREESEMSLDELRVSDVRMQMTTGF